MVITNVEVWDRDREIDRSKRKCTSYKKMEKVNVILSRLEKSMNPKRDILGERQENYGKNACGLFHRSVSIFVVNLEKI